MANLNHKARLKKAVDGPSGPSFARAHFGLFGPLPAVATVYALFLDLKH